MVNKEKIIIKEIRFINKSAGFFTPDKRSDELTPESLFLLRKVNE